MAVDLKNADIISTLNDLDREKILYLCAKAKEMHDLEKSGRRDSLANTFKKNEETGKRARVLAYLFYEPSTRTKFRFDTAMRELGGKRDGFAGTEGTSMMKNETIRDTLMMMSANHFDAIVMRHPKDGALQWAGDIANIPVINAGDGKNEHPTQALLDLFTIYMDNNKKINNLNLGLGGDLAHGRTIKSLTFAASHSDNITIRWAADDLFGMQKDLVSLLESRGVKVIREETVEDVIRQSEYYYMTRLQFEKHDKKLSEQEIVAMMDKYRITMDKINGTNTRIMHPLPVNGKIAEIDYPVFFTKNQLFFKQAENGIFLSKALLNEILNHDEYLTFNGRLHEDLQYGNNLLTRDVRKKQKKHLAVETIENGMVIDHLKYGIFDKISQIKINGNPSVLGGNLGEDFTSNPKAIAKIKSNNLSDRIYKTIILESAGQEPTFNKIRNWDIIEKFLYLLCHNDNCITREIIEDVPPKFYNDEGTIRCRYCRQSYEIKDSKVSEKEKQRFLTELPTKVKPIKYEKLIA